VRGSFFLLGVLLILAAQEAYAQTGLGRPATADELSAVDISIMPDGTGLPPGRGNAKEGHVVYAQKCLACHGENGQGKPADRLAGGTGSLAGAAPVRTVGSYWPYATTLFDYIRRAMPLNAPMSLSDDDVYAVTAYLLALNGIIGNEQSLDATTLAAVRMPNRDGFIDRSGVK